MPRETDAAMTTPVPVEPVQLGASPCRACNARTSGPRDLMCVDCWKALPAAVIALYRMVWRLTHAGLVPRESVAELERLVVRDAKEIRAGTGPGLRTARALAAITTAPAKPVEVRRQRVGPLTTQILAALPTKEADAVSSQAIAAKIGRDEATVGMALWQQRKAGLVLLRAKNLRPEAQRGLWLYWRAA